MDKQKVKMNPGDVDDLVGNAFGYLLASGYEWRIEKQEEMYRCVLWKSEWITDNPYAARPMPSYLGSDISDAIFGALKLVGVIKGE